MNPHIKLAVAFTVGVVVTVFFTAFINNAEAPNAETENDVAIVTESTSTEPTLEEETPNDPEKPIATTPKPPTPTPTPYVPPKEPVQTYPYSATVTYDGKFFRPEEVIVIEGGTVTFRNVSAEDDMWVASNFHPRHAVYPEQSDDDCNDSTFDQCESVGPGGVWSFKFNVQGGWFYHNEEDTIRTGKVRVLSKEEYDKER